MSADSGYCSEANLAELQRLGIRGYVATGRQKHGTMLVITSESTYRDSAGDIVFTTRGQGIFY